jgi:hypothetical protein
MKNEKEEELQNSLSQIISKATLHDQGADLKMAKSATKNSAFMTQNLDET